MISHLRILSKDIIERLFPICMLNFEVKKTNQNQKENTAHFHIPNKKPIILPMKN